MFIQGSPVEIHIPNAPERDRQQYDCPTDCFIAQRYSSATFVWCAFIKKKKISAKVSEVLLIRFINF